MDSADCVDPTDLYLQRFQIESETFTPLHIIVSECFDKTSLILWNQFCIHLYHVDELIFTSAAVHFADVSISKVIAVRNMLLLQDEDCVLNFTILRKEDDVHKRIVDSVKFKKIFDNILNIVVDTDKIGMVQYKENKYWFNLYNISGMSKFKLQSKFVINSDVINRSDVELYLKSCRYFSDGLIENISHQEIRSVDKDLYLLFIVYNDTLHYQFLRHNVNYFSRIHICPVTIKEIGFDKETCHRIYLSTVSGSVIILTYENYSVNVETIHLNCSLERILIKNDHFLYTDGDVLWSTTIEHIKNESSILRHEKLIPRNVYDVSFDSDVNRAYCTSVNNLIYVFKNRRKIKQDKNYIDVSNSLKGMGDIFDKILEETKRNELVLKNIIKENHLITIMALKEKPNIIMNNLFSDVQIHNNMKQIDHASENIILIDNIENYYKTDTYIYIVTYKISPNLQTKFKEILTPDFWHLNIQLRFETQIKTVCVDILNEESIKVAIPIEIKDITIPAILNVKLIGIIPSVHNENIQVWCLLPAKHINIDVKYYIRLGEDITNDRSDINNQILDISNKNSKLICKIRQAAKKDRSTPMSFYINIPGDVNCYVKTFAEKFVQCSSSGQSLAVNLIDGLLSDVKKIVRLAVLRNVIEICIVPNKGSFQKISISGMNIDICYQLYIFVRECLKTLINDGSKLVPHFDFMRLQKIKDVTSSTLSTSGFDISSLINLSEEFDRDIIGILPL